MQRIAAILLALAGIGVSISSAQELEIKLDTLAISNIALPGGEYVFRDSTSWIDTIRPYWQEPFPPPEPSFENAITVAISYGMTACYETGGTPTSTVFNGDEVVMSLSHVYSFMYQCAAAVPRVHYYQFSTVDLPEDVSIRFEHADEEYDLDPQRWYPLADGNAWHYADFRGTEWVQAVDGSVTAEDAEWHRIYTITCEEDACGQPNDRYLRWSEDHYLLQWESSGDEVDTLHVSTPRSIFTVNTRDDTTLSYGGKSLWTSVVIANDGPDDYLALVADVIQGTYDEWGMPVYYGYGIGPLDFFAAAVIDGKEIGDTSFISTMLSADPDIVSSVAPRIDVAPHPAGAQSVISYRAEAAGQLQLFVYDVLGRAVYQSSFEASPGAEWRIPLRNAGKLASGLYLIRVVDASGSAAERAMIVVD